MTLNYVENTGQYFLQCKDFFILTFSDPMINTAMHPQKIYGKKKEENKVNVYS